jgi:hypothetical protein
VSAATATFEIRLSLSMSGAIQTFVSGAIVALRLTETSERRARPVTAPERSLTTERTARPPGGAARTGAP